MTADAALLAVQQSIMSASTVAKDAEAAHLAKGSRFVARAYGMRSSDELESRLAEVRSMDPSASHHCWAYKVSAEYRFSDDGEPAGTAGRPIFEVLERRGLDRVLVVVTRYFGGVKLGAGGLARAYRSAASQVLDQAGTKAITSYRELTVDAPFAAIDLVHRVLDSWQGVDKRGQEFTPDGVTLSVWCPEAAAAGLTQALKDASSGAVNVRERSA